ncbi:PadR family transcriptional regulator [Cryptosporangium aurantiacum]|uniref:DNA-binding transcriptional regulator, PadR family n=1 Tax=Cryptosporangium aurantiacum TaxID=134849 RepID=A0A1M7HN88_9ACTN|nr:PadR family transcriptional regulator [Cryptosporangium aurantiacum]SHM29878.1 DNA-binding transcriptional regulator, PadR family [Cryptosporangium aurantiacum]
MARRRVSNPLALAALTLLEERPMHPYEMSATLRERRKDESIKLNYGSLYSVIESLQRHGLIEAQETTRDGRRPERTIYAITEAGLQEVEDWLSDLVGRPVKEYTQFEAALSLLGALPPEDAVRLLRLRLDSLVLAARSSAAVQQSVGNLPRIFMLENEYESAVRDAEIRFVRDLLHDIEHGSLSGLDFWHRIHELRGAGLPPDEVDAKLHEEFPAVFAPTDWPPEVVPPESR